MDNKYIEQLRTHVKDALRTDNMRYQHTLGVANTSACLAMCHGALVRRQDASFTLGKAITSLIESLLAISITSLSRP